MSFFKPFIFLVLISSYSCFISIVNSKVLNKYVSPSKLGVYEKGSVTANGWECADIGTDILKQGGSAVDAAIAALICEGVAAIPSMGMGGGFTMVIYDAKTNKTEFLNARDMAPSAATVNMFNQNANLSYSGGLAIAVPGELMGYWEAHKKYGKLPWKDLFKPSIKLCKTGSLITPNIEKQLNLKIDYIRNEKTLQFLLDPKTNKLAYKAGDKIKRPQLRKTLKRLAESKNAAKLFYEGTIADGLVKDIQAFGGIITKKDFKNYKVKWDTPLMAKFANYTMYTSKPPGSGVILAFILKVLENMVHVEDEKILWQRMVETFKWAHAKRSFLGDPDKLNGQIETFMEDLLSDENIDKVRKEIKDDVTYLDPKHYQAQYETRGDHGTGQVSVVAPDGSAVSVTSTINQLLGSCFISPSTGIVLNDQMDDFSSPGITNGYGLEPAPNNFIAPGKRPLSSTNPTILFDANGKLRMVVGAAGGSRINTATATAIIHNLFRGYTIKESIDVPRLHHQLLPMEVSVDKDVPKEILDYMVSIGHTLSFNIVMAGAVTAISLEDGKLYSNADWRKDAVQAGF